MGEERIVRRLNVVIVLLLAILGLQVAAYVSPIVLLIGAIVLSPIIILAVVVGFANL